MNGKDSGKTSEHSCAWCHGGKHAWLRLLLGIIILVAVFWLGVKIGEIKGAYKYGYPMMGGFWGSHEGYYNMFNMMNPGNYGPNGYYYGPGMMRGWWPEQAATTTNK